MTASLTDQTAEFRVHGKRNATNQQDAAIAARPDGGFQVVWESDGQDGDGLGIYGRNFAADGTVEGAAFLINDLTEGNQGNPDVVFAADGTGTWVWESNATYDPDATELPGPSGTGLQGIRSKSFGGANSEEERSRYEVDGDEFAARGPNVVALENDIFLASYDLVSNSGAFDENIVLLEAFNGDDTPTFDGSIADRNPTTVSQPDWMSSRSDIAALPDKGFVFLWAEAEDAGETGSIIRGEIRTNVGINNPQHSFDLDGAGEDGEATNPRVAILNNGNIAVAWQELDEGSVSAFDYNIWVQVLDSTGSPLNVRIPVHAESVAPQFFPEIVALPDGGFIVTWTDFANADGGGSKAFAGVFAQRFDEDGIALGEAAQINDTSLGNQQESALDVLEDGNVVITWESTFEEEGAFDVYAKLLNVADYSNSEAQLMRGFDGKNTINSGAESDTIDGAGGADSIASGNGADFVKGGGGADTINGGKGADFIEGENGGDSLIGGDGDDTADGAGGNDVIKGGSGEDSLTGGGGKDTIEGGSNDDRLEGENGKDKLMGNNGADNLIGGSGADTLEGGNGADRLVGGDGSDKMEGGAGADTFLYADGDDLIKDFEDDIDFLNIDADLDPTGLTKNKLAALADESVSGEVSFTFANGDTLTVRGIDTFADLRDDVGFF